MRTKTSLIHAAVIFFAILAGAPLPVVGAELTGFGQIKFGMTKKEAMAAINGKGRWETDDRLDYSYFWTEFDRKFTVQQLFRNGRAIATKVFGQDADRPFWHTCVSDTLRIVSAIKEKYQITPLIRNDLKNQMRLGSTVDRFTTDTYMFGFDGGAFIVTGAKSGAAG